MKGTSAYQVTLAFVRNWAFVYGIPKTMLTDKGTQFNAKLLIHVQRVLCVRHQFTSTYHLQSNRKSERYNRSVLSAMRKFVADHLEDWNFFADAVTYALNNQVQTSTGCTPFELKLSCVLPHLALESYEPSGREVSLARSQVEARRAHCTGSSTLGICATPL